MPTKSKLTNQFEINTFLDDVEKKLYSLQHFIRTTIGTTPLFFAEQLTEQLIDIKNLNISSVINLTINEYERKIIEYKTFLQLHNDEAIKIAEDIEEQHQTSIFMWKNYFYNLLESNDYRLSFTPNNTTFQNGFICYIKLLLELNIISSSKQHKHYFESYKHNALAQLLLDDQAFLEVLKSGQFLYGGEIGHLMMQRFLLIAPQTRGWKKILLALMPTGCFYDLFEKEFFKYNPEVFKAEIIKLVLYKRLLLQNGDQPVAWIGSANTLTKMLETVTPGTSQRKGIYLNCGEYDLTPEFNRAWLLTLIHMGYNIKLVERQFPSIEKAILSENPTNFVLMLANEIRNMDHNNSIAAHSQYHGGDSPTATSLETLLLMSMGVKVTQDFQEGTISLLKPKIANTTISHSLQTKVHEYQLTQRRHSYAAHTSMEYKTTNQLILKPH